VSQGNQIHTGIAYGDGRFVVVGSDGFITLVNKGNPSAWTTFQDANVGGSDLTAVTYGNGRFVAVGYGSAIFRSDPDGENWERSFGQPAGPLLNDVLHTP
jgi:photosystem II stability/assembly factor-like uncharacterized protein